MTERQEQLLLEFIAAEEAGDEEEMDRIAAIYQAYLDENGLQKPEWVDNAVNVLRAVGQGTTFGWGDEIEAYARSKLGHGDREELLGDIRDDISDFKEESPILAHGAEIAGGFLLPGFGGAGLARGAVTGFGRAARTAGVGAVSGGITGLGTADGDFADRVQNAAEGAAIGGVGGALLGGAERLLAKKGATRGYEVLNPRRGPRDFTHDDLMRKADEMGDGVPFAATSEPMTRDFGAQFRVAGQRDQDMVRGRLEDMMEGQGERINTALARATGVDPAVTRTMAADALEDVRDSVAHSSFGRVQAAANQAGFNPPGAHWQGVISTDPDFKAAANMALLDIQRRTENPNLTVDDVRGSFDFWHRLQSRVGEIARNKGTPNQPGSVKSQASALNQQRERLLANIEQNNVWGPTYRDARKEFASFTSAVDKARTVRGLEQMRPEDMRRMVDELGPEERIMVVQSLVSDLLGQIMRGSDTAALAHKVLNKNNTRANLAILVGDETKMNVLTKALQAEMAKLELFNEVLRGSPTADRLAALNQIDGGNLARIVTNAINGSFGEVFETVASSVTKPSTKRVQEGAARFLDLGLESSPEAVRRQLSDITNGALIENPVTPGLSAGFAAGDPFMLNEQPPEPEPYWLDY